MLSLYVSASRWLLPAILFIALLSSGCQNNDENPANSSNPRAFSVTFTGYETDDHPPWIVLHTLDGDSTVAAKHVPESGIVDFGVLETDRVSFTIVYYRALLESYMNAPVGDWTFPGGNDPYHLDSLGTANISVGYPAENYENHSIEFSGFNWYKRGAGYDSVMSHSSKVYRLDKNNRITIFAYVKGPVSNYCGWLLHQPFQLYQENSYSFQFTEQMQLHTMTCSRPVFSVYAGVYPDASEEFYYTMYDEYLNRPNPTTVYMTTSACPADKYELSVWGDNETECFSYECIVDNLPSSLTIPTTSISADLNVSAKAFENIAVAGEADMVRMRWIYHGESHWWVYVSPEVQTQSHPVVPDSILQRMGIDLSDLTDYYYIDLEDYDTAHGYDDCLALEYKSTLPWSQRFNTRFTASPPEYSNKSSLRNNPGIHSRNHRLH